MPNSFLGHEIEEWLPCEPTIGPPFPKWLNICWPWYKPELPPTVYTCPYCSAQFSTQQQLIEHIQTVHPQTPPITYACPYCEATFTTKEEVLTHIASAHPGQPPEVVYICPYCDQKFSSIDDLLQHIAAEHPAPTLYTCPICGATFSSQEELNQHIATAHPEQPPLPPGDYTLTAPLVSPNPAVVGDTVSISVQATNRTPNPGSVTASCQIDSEELTTTINLVGYGQERLIWEYIPQEAREYTILVPLVDRYGGIHEATLSLLVGVAPPPGAQDPKVISISWTPDPVPVRSTFDISLRVSLPKPFYYPAGWHKGEKLPAGVIIDPLYFVYLEVITYFDTDKPVYSGIVDWNINPDTLTSPETTYDLTSEVERIFTKPKSWPLSFHIEAWTGRRIATGWEAILPCAEFRIDNIATLVIV